MKKVVALGMSLLLCVFLSGCSPIYEIVNLFYGNEAVADTERESHIAFSNGTLFEDSEEVFYPASDFSEVKSEYSIYRSDLYFNALSPEEQNIYLAFEFALENSYKNILIDSSLTDDTAVLEKVLDYLSLDSPLLEQNLRYTLGDFTSSIPVDILGLYTDYADFDGVYITVDNFDSEMWDKKLEALAVARERVDALPEELSDIEKAEELYLSLAQSVEYVTYENDENTVYPYLYDALVTGKTHCDGHANALSLLLRLAEIDSCEKSYSGNENDEIGHTWVTFNVDGTWYNSDSTNSDMIPKKESSMRSGFYFAFSDDMQLYPEDYGEVTPRCEESKYMNPDAVVYNLSDNVFSNSVVSAFGKREPDWAFIIVHNNNSSLLEDQIQRSANETFSTVYWLTIDLADGSTAVIVYKKGLF